MSAVVTGREKVRKSPIQRLLKTWLGFSAANKFDDATWDPRAAQEEKLLELMERNAGSDYGKEHGFADVR